MAVGKFQLVFVIFVVFLQPIFGDETACISQETCETCLTADYSCAWCTDQTYATTKPRCMVKSDLVAMSCATDLILENSQESTIIDDKPLQDYIENAEIIQIKPQKAKLKLVKGHTTDLKMTYRSARNNPLDLYYLMDLTFSMQDDKQTLASVGMRLAQALGELTKNYRLGYGSFSDKPIMPMIKPGTEKNPCIEVHETCEPAYAFRHHLSMSSELEKFVREVNESKITANLDNLEGGLDALMQVIVCPSKIGWSADARKIVILATDGLMHFAGDGLLAGIVKRNDRKCHLNESGDYDAALEFDYPSLEEIYRELLQRKINVIFAVTKNVAQTYYRITDLMSDVSSVEILREDSSNILELVAKGYKNFVRKVNFVDNSPSFIDVTYKTDCGVPGAQLLERQSCNNLDIGQEVNFNIGFTVNDFPESGVYNHTIRVEETGLSEYLEVEIEIQEPCPCSHNKSENSNRSLCNNHGDFNCGMCVCDNGWIGKSCSCNSEHATNNALEAQCRPQLLNGTKLGSICSDHGECECGQCYCFREYTGPFCECPRCSDECNSKTADCKCGMCECKPGWTGPKCDCIESKDSCMSPTGELCSNQGECKCGRCECNVQYHGPFCESHADDDEFGNKICQFFKPCVESLIRERKGETTDIGTVCIDSDGSAFSYSFTDTLGDNPVHCTARIEFQNGQQCDYLYVYGTTNVRGKQLFIENYDCEPQNYAAVFIGGILATLLLGLLIMGCVKVYIAIQDKREFARFEEERKAGNWETTTSPLYERPIRECQMPDTMDGTEFN